MHPESYFSNEWRDQEKTLAIQIWEEHPTYIEGLGLPLTSNPLLNSVLRATYSIRRIMLNDPPVPRKDLHLFAIRPVCRFYVAAYLAVVNGERTAIALVWCRDILVEWETLPSARMKDKDRNNSILYTDYDIPGTRFGGDCVKAIKASGFDIAAWRVSFPPEYLFAP